MSNPIEVMFNKQRRAALSLLYLHPSERFYVREISRLTGVAAGSLHRELRILTEADLLLRDENGNNVYYQANTDSPLFNELVAIFHKTNDVTDQIRDAIMPLGERVAAAFIYSPRKSEQTAANQSNGNLNLFVIGSVTKEEVVSVLEAPDGPLQQSINLEVMRANEFSARVEQGDNFVTGVMNGYMRFIKGFS